MFTLNKTLTLTSFCILTSFVYAKQTLSLHPNPYLYSAAFTDSESHLQYLNARYYDPATMHFITWDTYSEDDKSDMFDQRYNYGGGDPVNSEDPSGHMKFEGIDLEDMGYGASFTDGEFAEAAMASVDAAIPSLKAAIPEIAIPASNSGADMMSPADTIAAMQSPLKRQKQLAPNYGNLLSKEDKDLNLQKLLGNLNPAGLEALKAGNLVEPTDRLFYKINFQHPSIKNFVAQGGSDGYLSKDRFVQLTQMDKFNQMVAPEAINFYETNNAELQKQIGKFELDNYRVLKGESNEAANARKSMNNARIVQLRSFVANNTARQEELMKLLTGN